MQAPVFGVTAAGATQDQLRRREDLECRLAYVQLAGRDVRQDELERRRFHSVAGMN